MYKIIVLLLLLFNGIILAHEPKVVKAGETEEIRFPGHSTYLLSDSESTVSEVAVLELDLPAKTFGAPPHIHLNEDEHFYVLSGNVEFLDRDKVVSVGPGGLLVLPRGNLHGFWNLSDEPAKLLLIVTPGKLASFFDDVVSQIRKKNPDNPKLVGQIIASEAAKYDVTIYPDKVPQSALSVMPK